MNGIELKPCPFCGGEAGFFDESDGYDKWYTVVCLKCTAQTDSLDSREEAAKIWNRRVGGAQ